MSDNPNNPVPTSDDDYVDNFIEENSGAPAEPAPLASAPPPPPPPVPASPPPDDGMNQRLERLGGEPAPVITPEEFARLQQKGQVNIDSRGRVRMARRSDEATAGVSLRKRRAWYR